MKKFYFPIPIEEIATKTYVDREVNASIQHAMGIIQEYFDDQFRAVKDNFAFQNERMERFELETGRRFKFVQNRLDDIAIEAGNFQTETRTNFQLVLSEVRELKEKIF